MASTIGKRDLPPMPYQGTKIKVVDLMDQDTVKVTKVDIYEQGVQPHAAEWEEGNYGPVLDKPSKPKPDKEDA